MASSGTPAAPAGLGENKAIKFQIKTGNARYTCTLQDRHVYERTKATRQNSTDSVSSTSSTNTQRST
ncbi:Fc.00g091040.m01.CDS01 [Cosmosporella sp. VM-42]